MRIYVWDGRRAHIAAVETEEVYDEAALDAALGEDALCGRRPARHDWVRAWQDEDDADLCDLCARIAEGGDYMRPAGQWREDQ